MLFLDCQFGIVSPDATERLFIYEIGMVSIFIYRMLMEHFANVKLD